MVQLEQKTSEETTNEVESMVSVIQEKIRKEKTERFRSEKEITLMREEMAKMQTEIHREKDIVENWVHNTEIIDKYFTEITDIENVQMLKETELQMAKMDEVMKKFDAKMKVDKDKRFESETALKLLQDQT